MKLFASACVFVLFCISATCVPAAGDTDALVKKIAAAYGGEAALSGARTVFGTGEISAAGLGRGMYRRYQEREGKLRVVIDYERSSDLRILNGGRAWQGGDAAPKEIEGFKLMAAVFQYKQFDLPYGLLTGKYEAKDAGRSTLGRREVELLDIKDAEGPPMRAYVDLKDYRILRVDGSFTAGGNPVMMSSEFSEFRVFGGLLLPQRIISYADGQKMSEVFVRGYRVNMPMEPSLFKP